MTKQQADNINLVFRKNHEQITKLTADLDGMRHISDSLATDLFKQKIISTQIEQVSLEAIHDIKKQRDTQARLMFFFWTAFVSYLHFF